MSVRLTPDHRRAIVWPPVDTRDARHGRRVRA